MADLTGIGSITDAVMAIGKSAGWIKDPEHEAQVELSLRQNEKEIQGQINATMQKESESEHWMQWAWRPTIGFTAAGVIVNNYILLPYFEGVGLKPILIPAELWNFMLIVLGLSAALRGYKQVVEAKG